MIRQEECISGHKLIIRVLDLKEGLNKRRFFQKRMWTRAALVEEKPTGIEEVWRNFKECLTEEAIEVCGETQSMRRHKESWWWNEEIAALVKKPRNNTYSNCGKGLRSAEKGIDVSRQTGTNSVDAGRTGKRYGPSRVQHGHGK